MSLQFEKLEAQIAQLGEILAQRERSAAEELRAIAKFLSQLDDCDMIWEQIKIARQNDVGFRGAAPFRRADQSAHSAAHSP